MTVDEGRRATHRHTIPVPNLTTDPNAALQLIGLHGKVKKGSGEEWSEQSALWVWRGFETNVTAWVWSKSLVANEPAGLLQKRTTGLTGAHRGLVYP